MLIVATTKLSCDPSARFFAHPDHILSVSRADEGAVGKFVHRSRSGVSSTPLPPARSRTLSTYHVVDRRSSVLKHLAHAAAATRGGGFAP
jgi:hypothetical protein